MDDNEITPEFRCTSNTQFSVIFLHNEKILLIDNVYLNLKREVYDS